MELQIAIGVLCFLTGCAFTLTIMAIANGREMRKGTIQKMPKKMKQFFHH